MTDRPWTPPEMTPGVTAPAPPGAKPGANGRVITLVAASEFPARPIRWLWEPYVPAGKVTMLAGAPGQGKSQLSLWLAAGVTRGEYGEPRAVVIVSAEDDPADTIVPRLTAVGADFNHITFMHVAEHERKTGDVTDDALNLPGDGKELMKRMAGHHPRIIIIDPVSSFLDSGIDSHKNASVRRALGPLKVIAEATGAAVFVITHFSKGYSPGEPLDKVIDSVAFTAIARSVILMGADPDDEDGTRGQDKVMVLAKSNVAPPGEYALRYRLHSAVVPTDLGDAATSCVELIGRADVGAGDLLMAPDERSDLSECMNFLRAELSGGWLMSVELRKRGDANGYSQPTIKRARRLVCGRARKQPGTGKWWVGLKGSSPPVWDESLDPLDGKSDDKGYVSTGQDQGHLIPFPGVDPDKGFNGPWISPVENGPLMDDKGIKGDNGIKGINGIRTAEARRAMERMLGESDDDGDDLF